MIRPRHFFAQLPCLAAAVVAFHSIEAQQAASRPTSPGAPGPAPASSPGGAAAPASPAVATAAPSAATAEITIQREVFDYVGSGRRDPYKSLMSTSDVRPLLSDLKLTAVAFDPDGDNSVAILRDSNSKAQYRVRVGQQLGRLRVSVIRQKSVQFTLDEFGFNRQETLRLSSDTTKLRNP